MLTRRQSQAERVRGPGKRPAKQTAFARRTSAPPENLVTGSVSMAPTFPAAEGDGAARLGGQTALVAVLITGIAVVVAPEGTAEWAARRRTRATDRQRPFPRIPGADRHARNVLNGRGRPVGQGCPAAGRRAYAGIASSAGVAARPSAPRRVRTIPQPTSAAATTVSVRPAIVTASRNSAVCCALQLDVAMSPVNSAARTVPVTAMPTPEATSVTVSTSAAPTVVRFFGRPRSTLVAATTPTTRIPAATSASAIATQSIRNGSAGRRRRARDDRRGTEPCGPSSPTRCTNGFDERAAREQDDDLREHPDGGECGRPPPVELQLQRHHVAEAGGRQPGRGLERQAAGDQRVRNESRSSSG